MKKVGTLRFVIMLFVLVFIAVFVRHDPDPTARIAMAVCGICILVALAALLLARPKPDGGEGHRNFGIPTPPGE